MVTPTAVSSLELPVAADQVLVFISLRAASCSAPKALLSLPTAEICSEIALILPSSFLIGFCSRDINWVTIALTSIVPVDAVMVAILRLRK